MPVYPSSETLQEGIWPQYRTYRGFWDHWNATDLPKFNMWGNICSAAPTSNPSTGNFRRRKAAQPLCRTLENPRGVAHTSNRGLMFCCGVRWLLGHGWGISLLKSLAESRGWMRELLGRDSGGFSNPLLPSAARALPGSQKRSWKTFPEPISLLSQPGRCPCLSLPAGRVCADKNVDPHS